jgi:hypothetical protein
MTKEDKSILKQANYIRIIKEMQSHNSFVIPHIVIHCFLEINSHLDPPNSDKKIFTAFNKQ